MPVKTALSLIAVAALCGCGQSKTQDYYLAHPGELATDLAACHKAGKNTFDCNEADKAEFSRKQQAGK